jgi:hypothetical protein
VLKQCKVDTVLGVDNIIILHRKKWQRSGRGITWTALSMGVYDNEA